MYVQLTNRLILALVLCQGFDPVIGDIADVGHYFKSLIDSIIDIYASNGSRHSSSAVAANSITNLDTPKSLACQSVSLSVVGPVDNVYKLHHLLLFIQQVSAGGKYDKSSSLELQELHVLNHPLPNFKGCVTLDCLLLQLKSN